MVQEHSSQLVWQIVKGWNSHIVKGLNGTNRKGGGIILSKEPGNLYNKHSYKYSGLQAYAVARPCTLGHVSHCSHSVPAAGICNTSAVRIKQPCLSSYPDLPLLQASATTWPCSWSSLAACLIHTSHHIHAVSAAGLCSNRTPHTGQFCRLHASMPQTMQCLLQALVPARLCSCSSLVVCSTHASQHGPAVAAAGLCSSKTGLTEQQACCLHLSLPHIMTLPHLPAGICNDKTLHVEQDQGNVKVVRNRKGSVNRPVSAKVGATRKRHIRLLSGNLGKEVQGYRPDLKVRTLVPAPVCRTRRAQALVPLCCQARRGRGTGQTPRRRPTWRAQLTVVSTSSGTGPVHKVGCQAISARRIMGTGQCRK